jgi:20S proteasome alpha/beta subunit
MTIAAGFRVKDGILVCADTQYTGGVKIHQPKVFRYEIGAGQDSCALAFALAGHEVYGKMAIEDCAEEIEKCAASARSLRTVKGLLRKAVRSIALGYVDSRPDLSDRDVSRFELVIAAWLPRGGGLSLFRASGPGLILVDNYYCAGSGAYLADYLVRSIFTRHMSIESAVLMATQALAAAKSYDPSCGGDSEFVMLSSEGKLSEVATYNTRNSETFINAYESMVREFLFRIGDLQMSDRDFTLFLETFVGQARIIRESWRKSDGVFRELLGTLDSVKQPE